MLSRNTDIKRTETTRLKTIVRAVFTGTLTLFCKATLLAQVLYGTLVGNITDPTHGVIPNATITITDPNTGSIRTAQSDDTGIYRLLNLSPGIYTVSVSAPGLARFTATGVVVHANEEVRVNAELSIATIEQKVTVTGEAPQLQTDTAAITSELEAKQLETIVATPGVGMRNFQSLYMVLPGFTPPATDHSEAGNPSDTLFVNVNGISGSNNDTRIDGVSDIYPWLPEIAAYTPSIEAIRSVNIVTNSFDAQQGFASGASINVTTKSGTNQYHGGVWEYNTISALQAKGYYVPATTAIPKYILNQFGANLGAPIRKNKAFYFVNYEGERRSQAVSGYQTLPTANMLAGNFQGTGTTIYDPATGNADGTGRTVFSNNTIPTSRFSTAAAAMIKLLPSTNISTSALSNNFFTALDASYRRDNVDSRVDFNLSTKSTVFVRYGFQNTNLFDPVPLGAAGGNTLDSGQPGNAPSLIQALGLGGTYTFTPHLLLDGNFGFTRQGLKAQPIDLGTNAGLTVFQIPGTNGSSQLQGGSPAFTFTGLSSLGDPNKSNPFQFRDNVFTGGLNLTWIRGRHTVRVGAETQHYALNHFQPQNTVGPRGGFSFNGGKTVLNGGTSPNGYNAWADFLLGLPYTSQKDTQFLNPSTLRENVWAGYIRDQWQVTDKLTLNFGIRYEVYPFPKRDHTGLQIFDATTGLVNTGGVAGVPENAYINTGHGIWGPRIGVAYRVDEKIVIRAGYGLSANPDNYRNVLTAYPTVLSQSYTSCTTFTASGYLNSNNPTVLPTGKPATGCTDNSALPVGIPTLSTPDITSGSVSLPATISTTTFPKNYRRGYYETYNLAVQRELPNQVSLQAVYVGDLIIREVPGQNINYSDPGGATAGEVLYKTLGITAAQTSEIPDGTGNYNGLQVSSSKRFSRGASLGLNYTYSKAINDYGDQSDGSSGLPVADPNYWYKNRSVAGFDRKHNIQLFGNYEVPGGSGQSLFGSRAIGLLLGGWGLAGTLSRESGTPFTVSASSSTLNAVGSSQFADQLVSKVQILGGHDSTHPYFNTANFQDPAVTVKSLAQDRFGTASRNSVRGPGLFNVSSSVSRAFPVRDWSKVIVRAEVFNLTNTPSFSNPSANVSTTSNFGIISGTQSSPRSVRLSGRIEF